MKERPGKPIAGAVIDWATGHPRHLGTALWLSSWYGARVLPRPPWHEIEAFLVEFRARGPLELHAFVARLVTSLPSSVLTLDERERLSSLLEPPPSRLEPLGMHMVPRLIAWCRQRQCHVLQAWWLLSVHGSWAVPRPGSDELKQFLVDVREHAPGDLFEFVASMLEVLPTSVASKVECEAFLGLIELLRTSEETL